MISWLLHDGDIMDVSLLAVGLCDVVTAAVVGPVTDMRSGSSVVVKMLLTSVSGTAETDCDDKSPMPETDESVTSVPPVSEVMAVESEKLSVISNI